MMQAVVQTDRLILLMNPLGMKQLVKLINKQLIGNENVCLIGLYYCLC